MRRCRGSEGGRGCGEQRLCNGHHAQPVPGAVRIDFDSSAIAPGEALAAERRDVRRTRARSPALREQLRLMVEQVWSSARRALLG